MAEHPPIHTAATSADHATRAPQRPERTPSDSVATATYHLQRTVESLAQLRSTLGVVQPGGPQAGGQG